MDKRSPPASVSMLFLTILFVLVTAGACSYRSSSPPVEDSTLVPLLAELHVLDARQQTFGDTLTGLRDSVFARHGVDSAAFAAAMSYYEEHIDEYTDLYGRVLDHLRERQDHFVQQDTLSRSSER